MENEINKSILFLNSDEELEILNAIKLAEKKTSGEIRVHITKKKVENALAYAKKIFNKYKLYETQQRNAVLIFIATEEKTFTIIGDEGINQVVKQQFWDEVIVNVIQKFKTSNYFEGILLSINAVGEKLMIHFPYEKDDKNELPDEIFYS